MNVDVVFKLAGSYETMQVETLLDIPVREPAAACIGVLAEHPPEDPPGPRSKRPWRGDLVAIWWPNRDESEAQAFELCTNGAAVRGITHSDDKIAPWLKKNVKAIGAEAQRFKAMVEDKLQKHVAEQLEEHRRLADEANDKVANDEAFMEGVANAKVRVAIVLDIHGDEQDAVYVLEKLLDAGTLQDDINDHELDAGGLTVASATVRVEAREGLHSDPKPKKKVDRKGRSTSAAAKAAGATAKRK